VCVCVCVFRKICLVIIAFKNESACLGLFFDFRVNTRDIFHTMPRDINT